MNEKLLKNINHYGVKIELRKLNEECFELIEAIRDYEEVYSKHNYKQYIIGEIADVMVLLNQFKLYYGISDEEVKEVMIKKIDRQMERIENDRNLHL